jgi:HK97 family phage portal protein
MQISACWAAIRILAETVASLPFEVYRHTDKGRVPANVSVRDLIKRGPNRYQTSVEFWESVMLNLASSGNAYVAIERVGGEIVSLLPLSSSQVETTLLKDGSIVHTYTSGSSVKVYASESVWHIKLFGNGVVGMSPLSYARNSLGIAIAADNLVTKTYRRGGKPTGVLSLDAKLKPGQRDEIRTAYSDLESGDDGALYVLEAGAKYTQVSMSPQDLQLMESRRFQIEDIGRFFGVPSVLLNQTTGQSSLGSNVYEIMQAFYKLNLRPYLEKIESSFVRWLLPPGAWRDYEVEFDFDALLRADTLSRMQAYREAINTAQLTPNEARGLEGRVALAGGDKLLIQGAMIPIEDAGRGSDDGKEKP